MVRRNLPHGKFQVIQDDAPKGTISLRSRARVPFLVNKARLARLSGRRHRRIATMIEWVLTPDAGASLRSAVLKPFENKGFWARHGIGCVVLVCDNLPVAPICRGIRNPVGWFCREEIIEIRASSGPQRPLCVLVWYWDRQPETHSSAQTL